MTLNKNRKVAILISLVLLVILSYSNTLYSPFTLDDFHSFIESPALYTKDFSFNSLSNLSNTVFGKSRIIPIITFALDHNIGKGNIAQYHITNISIHILNIAAILWLISLILKTAVGRNSIKYLTPFVFCFSATALWALNPVQTNAINYIVQRMASLSTLFYVTSLSLYIHTRISDKTPYHLYLLSAFFAALAFSSKQNSATLPIAILMIEEIFINPGFITSRIRNIKIQYWAVLILLLLAISPLLNIELAKLLQGYSNRHFTLGERLLTEGRVVVFYITLLLIPLPSRMNMEHDFSVSTSLLSPPSTLLAILILSCLLYYALRYAKVYPILSFGILWYFLNIALESTILPLELAFEHRNYLPSIGLFIAIISATDLLANFLRNRIQPDELQKILGLLLLIVISGSSILTTLRNNDWRDHLSLAENNVAKSPHKPRALSAYGTALARNKQYEESITYFKKAIAESRPGYENYLDSTGNTLASLAELGKEDEAIEQGEKFLKEMPKGINMIFFTKYINNLGTLHAKAGHFDLAYEYFLMALRSETPGDNGHLIASMTSLLNKIYDDLKYREIYHLKQTGDKTTDIILKVAQILLDVRDYDTAFEYINTSIKMAPDHTQAQKLLNRYQVEIDLNKAAQQKSTITDHDTYKQNFKYRIIMRTTDFVFNYYPPLKNLNGNFLQKSLEQYPDDQFIILYLARWLSETDRQDEALALIEKTLANHPKFIPLLERSSRFYRGNNLKEKYLKTCRDILSIYPGVSNWNEYETALNKAELNATRTQQDAAQRAEKHA